jgi:hypothetical protein
VGTCIGEKNHARFWWFLLFQCVELLLGVLVVTARFQPPPVKSSWTQANSWPLFILLILVVGGLHLHCTIALNLQALTVYNGNIE